jgi:magnesium-transporting ATPase (P-type)
MAEGAETEQENIEIQMQNLVDLEQSAGISSTYLNGSGTTGENADVDGRKAYYELQQIDKLTFYKNILKILYFIAVFVFIIKAIVIKRKFKNKFLWFITFILILFPFMLTYIRTLYLNVLSFIDNILPKNVYSDI